MQAFCDKHGFTPDDIQNMGEILRKNLLFKVDLLYEGIRYAAKREGAEVLVTWDDVEAWFSDNPGFSAAFVQVWESQQAPPPEDDKKKGKEKANR